MLFDTFHNRDCLIVSQFLCPNVPERKIDDEPQSADLFVLFYYRLFQFVIIHVMPSPQKATVLQVVVLKTILTSFGLDGSAKGGAGVSCCLFVNSWLETPP